MEWIKKDNASSIKEVFMRNMGIRNISEANGWFAKSYADGYRIDGLKEACALIEGYRNNLITIVGDYDADGVTSTTILYLGLKGLGFKNVKCRIPKRFSEGFGINETIIDGISQGLIITCDNGIAGISAIKKAREKGLKVIVTDHHQPVIENGEKVFPEADVIIDPNALDGSADYSGYCGAGLSLRLIRELSKQKDRDYYKRFLPFAAIGTVADVMELREENYVIVRNGIEMMNDCLSSKKNGLTSGLRELLKITGCGEKVTAGDIAYRIAPTINSFSRLKDEGANDAAMMLIFDGDQETAEKKARAAQENNTVRKRLEADGTEKAIRTIKECGLENTCPITVYVRNVHEGVVGIIAAKIAEKYHKPALVFTDIPSEPDLVKGSARGYGNYNVKAEFDKCAELFVNYGGHAGAAGMTVKRTDFIKLSSALCKNAVNYDPMDELGSLFYDLEVEEKDLEKAISEKEKYAPYGEGNPEPVFLVKNFFPVTKQGSCKILIGGGKGVKINGMKCEAVNFSFNGSDEGFDLINPGERLDMVGNISLNRYGSYSTPQIVFKEIRKAS